MTIFEYVNEQQHFYYSYCGSVDYQPLTTLFNDFALSEYGDNAPEKIKELYETVSEQFIKAGAEFSADCAMCLNLKSWYFYEIEKAQNETFLFLGKEKAEELQELYTNLFYKFKNKALDNLPENEVSTFLDIID